MSDSLRAAIQAFPHPIFGICAGLIVLGSLGLLGSTTKISRNSFGSQKYSAIKTIELTSSFESANLNTSHFFIRAPSITELDDSFSVLARVDDAIICAIIDDKKRVLATAFHPEISSDDSWMRYFLETLCAQHTVKVAEFPSQTERAPWSDQYSTAVKRAFALFQKGGVIMDVVCPEQARLAEAAGAVAVMALERIPADIKKDGGVARASDPKMIREIVEAVSIPVMAKARIGHFAEAQIIEAIEGVDCIDESEVLTAADEQYHIDKRAFSIPFVCGAKDLGEALRRIAEGASMIRVKGNAGTGNVMNAVRHARTIQHQIRSLAALCDEEVFDHAKEMRVSIDLLEQTRALGRLPVVLFAAGGIATPADVSLLMQLGVDGVFVGSGIFKGDEPERRARACVEACTHYLDPALIGRVSEGLGKAMVGILDKGESYVLTNNDDRL